MREAVFRPKNGSRSERGHYVRGVREYLTARRVFIIDFESMGCTKIEFPSVPCISNNLAILKGFQPRERTLRRGRTFLTPNLCMSSDANKYLSASETRSILKLHTDCRLSFIKTVPFTSIVENNSNSNFLLRSIITSCVRDPNFRLLTHAIDYKANCSRCNR